MDFAVSINHRGKFLKTEKREQYLVLARKLKKLFNLKLTGIPTLVDEGLVQGLADLEIRGQMKIIQTTALLRSARILRRVLET